MDGIFNSSLVGWTETSTEESFDNWLKERGEANEFKVERIDFDQLDKWYFEPDTANLKHESGKFFTIEGVSIKTDFGDNDQWAQAIINQPEVGILGIITKKINGVRHFLLQAKMEPGNVNTLQISPTLQATKSNYKLAHKGKTPLYLEYFLDTTKATIVVDQLQSEQGGRFLRKRNRNMIVEVKEDIAVNEDFYWLTLGQIKILMNIDNLVNMDARSVISCIPFHCDEAIEELGSLTSIQKGALDRLLINSLQPSKDDIYSLSDQISWITEQKIAYHLQIDSIPLNQVQDWIIKKDVIEHKHLVSFKVIAVKVTAGNREVSTWSQPLVADLNLGLIGFILKEINGKYYFLVQAKVEAGNIDVVDMAPTVSCSNYANISASTKNIMLDKFINAKPENILYDKIHSEEGGRFYHLQNRYMLIIDNDIDLSQLADNFRLMTLSQIMVLSQFSYFNIESRGLIACLSYLNKV